MGNIIKKKLWWLYDKSFNFSNYRIRYHYDFLEENKYRNT